MHRLSSLALASVFVVQVGSLSFECASEEMLLEPELPCQQVLATSVQPRDSAPLVRDLLVDWIPLGCYKSVNVYLS
jgi:hypothetical protein